MNSAMIALPVPSDVAERLNSAIVRAELPEGTTLVEPRDMHVTLMFLGSAAELEPERVEIAARVAAWASELDAPLVARIGGIGRFTGNESDAEKGDAVYASVDADWLPLARETVVYLMRSMGIEPGSAHGFTPHITLGYVPADAPMPDIRPDNDEIAFQSVVLAFGDQQTEFLFKGGTKMLKAASPSRADWISARWMPYVGVDLDNNWYDSQTRVHKQGEITPGVLVYHGMAFGGDASEPGRVVGWWENALGRNVDIALDPSHPDFEKFKAAAEAGTLYVSGGYIPGYTNYDARTGYMTDVAVSEISLIVAGDGRSAKHAQAIAVPYARRAILSERASAASSAAMLKACGCTSCTKFVQPERVRAQFKAAGVDYSPPFPVESVPAQAAPAKPEAELKVGKRMSRISETRQKAAEMLKAKLSGSEDSELLAWLIDLIAGNRAESLENEDEMNDNDDILKAAPPALAATLKALPADQKAELAVFLKAAAPAATAVADARVAELEGQLADERQRNAEMAETLAGRDDESWFNGLLDARKAVPAERDAALAAVRNARRADATMKGVGDSLVAAVKAGYENRAQMNAPVALTGNEKLVSHGTDPDSEAAARQAEIDKQVNSMLAGTPLGRQALAQNKK